MFAKLKVVVYVLKMLNEKFEQSQTSSNIVQHRPTLSNMFDCAVQTGQTVAFNNFDNVWPTCLIRLNGPLHYLYKYMAMIIIITTYGNDHYANILL